MTPQDRSEMIGRCHGLSSAMVTIKNLIGVETYHDEIHPRHTRKLRRREDRLALSIYALELLERDLRRVQDVLNQDSAAEMMARA